VIWNIFCKIYKGNKKLEKKEKKQRREKYETRPGGNGSAQIGIEPAAHLPFPEPVPSVPSLAR
jgi:hypothetical protein